MKRKFMLAAGIAAMLVVASCSSGKQVTSMVPEIKTAIDSNKWVFVAGSVSSNLIPNRVLETGYEIKLNKGKLTCYLPYSGSMSSGGSTVNSGNGNQLDFTTEEFTMRKEEPNKRGDISIVIKLINSKDLRQMRFTVYKNGTGTMDADFTNRSPSTYIGNFTELK